MMIKIIKYTLQMMLLLNFLYANNILYKDYSFKNIEIVKKDNTLYYHNLESDNIIKLNGNYLKGILGNYDNRIIVTKSKEYYYIYLIKYQIVKDNKENKYLDKIILYKKSKRVLNLFYNDGFLAHPSLKIEYTPKPKQKP